MRCTSKTNDKLTCFHGMKVSYDAPQGRGEGHSAQIGHFNETICDSASSFSEVGGLHEGKEPLQTSAEGVLQVPLPSRGRRAAAREKVQPDPPQSAKGEEEEKGEEESNRWPTEMRRKHHEILLWGENKR